MRAVSVLVFIFIKGAPEKTPVVVHQRKSKQFITELFKQPIKSHLCVNSITLSWIENIKHTWFGRLEEARGRHENVVCLLLCLCANFVQPFPPLPPYLLHDPFVADTLFCLRKNASKSGIQGGGFANTQCGHLMCFREKNLPFTEEKESVAKRKQLLIMFSVHHCNPLFEEVGCGCLVRSVCPLDEEKKNKFGKFAIRSGENSHPYDYDQEERY